MLPHILWEAFCCQNEALKVSTSRDRTERLRILYTCTHNPAVRMRGNKSMHMVPCKVSPSLSSCIVYVQFGIGREDLLKWLF
jgi:hypothetical protein